jgi:hypothetical protein
MCVLTLVFYVLVYYSSDCIKGRYMDVVEWSRELDVREQKGVLYNREGLLKETKAKAASPVTFFIGKLKL